MEKLTKLLADLDELVKTLNADELKKALGPENMKHVQAIHDKAVTLGAKHNGTHDKELAADGYTQADDGDEPSEKTLKMVANALVKLGVAPKAALNLTKTATATGSTLSERLDKVEKQPATGATASSVAVDQLATFGAANSGIFRPQGTGVGAGEEALKAVSVLQMNKVARAAALPSEGGSFKLPTDTKSNLAKLA